MGDLKAKLGDAVTHPRWFELLCLSAFGVREAITRAPPLCLNHWGGAWVLALWLCLPLHGLAATGVEVVDGRVSVDVRDASLDELLTDIARQTGIKVRFVGKARERQVTVKFSDLPFQQALKRLLVDVPGKVVVLGKDGAGYAGVTGVYVLQALGEEAPTVEAPVEITDIHRMIESMPRADLTSAQRQALLDATNPVERPALEAVAVKRARLIDELLGQVQSGTAADNQALLQSLRKRLLELRGDSSPDAGR